MIANTAILWGSTAKQNSVSTVFNMHSVRVFFLSLMKLIKLLQSLWNHEGYSVWLPLQVNVQVLCSWVFS